MSSKCEDLNPGTDISNATPLAEAIGGPLSQCRPSGHFTTFIHRDDPIHDGVIGRIDGMNVKFPDIPGYTDGSGNAIQGGELAEGFDGFIDLDWESENFGQIDGNYGFKNTKLSRSPLNLFGAGEFMSLGVYQDNRKGDKEYFDAILSHPNTVNSLKLQLMSLKKWADFHKIPHDEVEKRLRDNAEDNKEFLANNYNLLVESNIEYDDLIEGGMINHLTADGKDFGQSNSNATTTEEITDANTFLDNDVEGFKNDDGNLQTNPIGIGDPASIVKTFDEAPAEFATAFGLEKNAIVSLKYPHDAVYGEPGVAGQDHIVIEQFQYQPPQAVFLDPKSKQTSLSYLNGLRRNSNIKQFIGVTKMPIPNNLSFSNGVSWGDSKLNSIQAAAFFSAFGGITKTIGEGDITGGIGELGKDLSNLLAGIKDGGLASGEPANLALSSFLAQFALGRAGINVDGNAALTRGTGAAINPNLELLFNGPKLRNFTFAFQFAPNDELDASIMRRIQKFFKMGMSPVRNSDNLLFLGSPNVFRLRYRTQEDTRIKGLPMHKICALTQCEINYAPDNVYQSYEDSSAGSSPVRTVMTMNFTELTPIFQDDYLGKDEVGTAAEFVEKNTFNDIYDEGGMGGMQEITAEDTGF